MRHVMLCGLLGDERDPGDAEVWVVNQAYKNHAKPDRVYFFDRLEDFDSPFVKYLNELGCPIYCRRVFPELCNSIEYPIQDVVKKLGIDYFTSSVSYMIAHALYEGVEKLTIHGMYSAMDSLEYISHIPCVNFWIGRAMSRMSIVIGTGSLVASPYPWQPNRYGYVRNRNESVANQFLSAAYIGAMNVPLDIVQGEAVEDACVPRVVNT